MLPNKNRSLRASEAGNVFIFILLGVVLFSALAFTVSRGMQSQTTSALSDKEIDLAVTDLLTYAQKIERAVDRVRRNGCSENEISFENPIAAGYAHSTPPPDKCQIFNSAGGGLVYKPPPNNFSADNNWYFYTNRVGRLDSSQNIGTAAMDLTVMLRLVDPDICRAINEKIGNTPTMWESGGNHNGWNLNLDTLFVGSFATSANVINVNGNGADAPSTGCFCDGAAACEPSQNHFFYHTILVR